MTSKGTTVDDASTMEADPGERETLDDSPPRTHLSSRYQTLLTRVSSLDTPVTIDRLVDTMFHWEQGPTGSAREKSWFDVHEELFRIDLPVLDRRGILRFDAETGLISTSPDDETDQAPIDDE